MNSAPNSRFAGQPWLASAGFDTAFVLLPAVFSVAIVFFLNYLGLSEDAMTVTTLAWILLILCIDVSHVYSTLFRTYFNSNEFRENRKLLTLLPIVVWLFGVLSYAFSSVAFWRILAYVAVFHFIRQQYGFLRLYSRAQKEGRARRLLDAAVIYLSTLYPIAYWHSHERQFHWFIDGDFFSGVSPQVASVFGVLEIVALLAYAVVEIRHSIRTKFFNLPKNGIVVGTALSWYTGIVLFNGDLAFTITNVVSHGIPYMALIWIYGSKQMSRQDAPLIFGRLSFKLFFSRAALPIFLAVLILFGFIEEGLWAGFVWREHLEVFGVLAELPHVTSKETLSWLVPLLTLPQATHYVLDGFIWKLNKTEEAHWRKILSLH